VTAIIAAFIGIVLVFCYIRIEFLLDQIRAQLKGASMSNPQLDTIIAQLHADSDRDNATLTFIQSVPALISDAVAKAVANGATPEQLQALTDIVSELSQKGTSIAAAIAANTVAAPGAVPIVPVPADVPPTATP
jgi:hypothetical protein